MRKGYCHLILFLLFTTTSYAQLQGIITDEKGEALSFANIYIQGTSTGTTSNIDGIYSFDLKSGTYSLVFQYVGYKQLVQKVTIQKTKKTLDIQLKPEVITLSQIQVKANAEDPAYAIIRKAMAKRKYYRDLVEAYSCKVYVKGMQKIVDTPDKIFGRDIGDMGGNIDSARQGIIYLSESQSVVHFQQPDQFKEEMISSKVSGNIGAFSFNRAAILDFNFYENTITIEREIISPIGKAALFYYKFKLAGTLFDESGRLINKIEVIPKRPNDPVFRGYIYIVEDLWNIQSIDVFLLGKSIKKPMLDTLSIRQIHVPLAQPDVWRPLSQTMNFSFEVMGFEFEGNFTGVYSDYELTPVFPKDFFNNEIFKVKEEANTKDSLYWATIRPVPLTIEEIEDYSRKDSLQRIWNSESYLDSIDRKRNKFSVFDLLGGYTFRNRKKRQYFTFVSPLASVQFNPIQGFHGNIAFSFLQEYDAYNIRWWQINTAVQYGFADEKTRGELSLVYNFNKTNFANLELKGGWMTSQFNPEEPILPFVNSVYAMWIKESYLRIYDKQFALVKYGQELRNGLELKSKLEYVQRKPLVNHSTFSFSKKERGYKENIPEHKDVGFPVFGKHKALLFEVTLQIRFAQKYMTYPGRKINISSKWPSLLLSYQKGIPRLGNSVDFDKGSLTVEDDFSLGAFGYSKFQLTTGTFFQKNSLSFIDYQHFNGNQTLFGRPSDYLNEFKLLDYYTHSTNRFFIRGHYEHHFDGFILDKIPLIRYLQFEVVAGFSILHTDEKREYVELSIGLENVGFKMARLFRVDLVSGYMFGKQERTGIRVGIDF